MVIQRFKILFKYVLFEELKLQNIQGLSAVKNELYCILRSTNKEFQKSKLQCCTKNDLFNTLCIGHTRNQKLDWALEEINPINNNIYLLPAFLEYFMINSSKFVESSLEAAGFAPSRKFFLSHLCALLYANMENDFKKIYSILIKLMQNATVYTPNDVSVLNNIASLLSLTPYKSWRGISLEMMSDFCNSPFIDFISSSMLNKLSFSLKEVPKFVI